MADTKLSDLSTLLLPASNDLLYIVDVSDTTDNAAGSSKAITLANLIASTGKLLQIQYSIDGAVATRSTAIPWDNSIPQQSTEGGTALYSVTITPTASSSRLLIWSFLEIACSSATNVTSAVFVDSTEDAIHFRSILANSANFTYGLCGPFIVNAGSTSARTYKLKAGGAGGTVTINGVSGGRIGGGVGASGLIVMEIAA